MVCSGLRFVAANFSPGLMSLTNEEVGSNCREKPSQHLGTRIVAIPGYSRLARPYAILVFPVANNVSFQICG